MNVPDPELEIAPDDAPIKPWMVWSGVAVLLLVSAAVLITAPRALNSQVAMGQGLPSTSLGEIVQLPEALSIGFLPEGFTFVAEETDGIDRVVQRYRYDGDEGRQLLVVTTVHGSFDPSRALAASDSAEPVAVDGRDGVLVRSTDDLTGEESLSVRVQVDDARNVIVRGVGGVPLDDLVAVAASVVAG